MEHPNPRGTLCRIEWREMEATTNTRGGPSGQPKVQANFISPSPFLHAILLMHPPVLPSWSSLMLPIILLSNMWPGKVTSRFCSPSSAHYCFEWPLFLSPRRVLVVGFIPLHFILHHVPLGFGCFIAWLFLIYFTIHSKIKKVSILHFFLYVEILKETTIDKLFWISFQRVPNI